MTLQTQRTSLAIMLFGFVVLAVLPAQAQLAPIEVEGQLLAATAQSITIRQEGTDEILIGLIDPQRIDDGVRYTGVPEAQITIRGTEDTSFLATGMFVRLQAKLEGNGKRVAEPVSEVTVITPDQNTAFGATPLNPRADDAEAPEAEEAFVVGQLRAARRTSMVVAYPNGDSLKVPLSRDAVVKIEASDGRYVRPGDKVQAKGLALRPPRFFATEITITRVEDPDKAALRARAALARGAGKAEPADPKAGPMPEGNPKDPFALGDPMAEAKPGEAAKPAPRRKILKIN